MRCISTNIPLNIKIEESASVKDLKLKILESEYEIPIKM